MLQNHMRCKTVNMRPAKPPKAGMSIEAAPAEDVDEAEEEEEVDKRTDDEPAVEEAEFLLIDEPEESPDEVDEELKLDPEAVTLPLPPPAANTELVLVLVMTTTTDVMDIVVAAGME
ncbi:hypothetical protein D6D01_09479 [Aureobasidium pullulans]|uniref:Uncharacterized protein n=1 Tax=Aureobasidium pullulans TaxID=5580 RepID=A0A4S9K529_AURPU|nr:hypothetical protein D6D01_09479 [Aureobasidium pullulans]